MFVKNLLTAGDLLTVVPAGLPVTLQYDEKGIIQKVLEGYEDDAPDISSMMLKPLLKRVPTTIPVKNGTTWIKGVLYTDTLFDGNGLVRDVSGEGVKSHFIDDPDKYTFYAGNVSSLATQFKGAMPIRHWLSMAHFNVLPGFLIPADITKEKFIQMIDRPDYPFEPSLIMYYMIYRKGSLIIEPTNILQCVAKSVSQSVDDYGYIWGKIAVKNDATPRYVNYSDVVTFNIQTNTAVVFDHENQVIYSRQIDNKVRDRRSKKISCTVCGKVFECPAEGSVRCPDSHCNSRMYPQVSHMFASLGLTIPTSSMYDKILKHRGTLFSVVEVLDEDLAAIDPVVYGDIKIEVPVYSALWAVIPVDEVRGFNFIVDFCNRCNNNVNTVSYYINHPDRMATDLGLVMNASMLAFIKWLGDPQNVADVESILHHPKVKIVRTQRAFDGPPIFRNHTIYITGAFIHGNATEVSAIIRSYGAEVVTEFNDKVTRVLIGDCNDGINAAVVKQASAAGLPIMHESDFFSKYDIDTDLAQNL